MLYSRDSSVATVTSASGINPDYITEVLWWQHPNFINENYRKAAELVAFSLLDTALRSRETQGKEAIKSSEDGIFKNEIKKLFKKIQVVN